MGNLLGLVSLVYPSESNFVYVDKFNYLTSLLESSAAEAIAGLSITSANYEEAISTLKGRFGNTQLIINQHMEALLGVASVTSHNHTRSLRKLYNTVEAHIRGFRSLGVSTESYGGLLASVLVNKLPPEIKLIVSRVVTGEKWELDRVMRIFEEELNARERIAISNPSGSPEVSNSQRKKQPRLPTATALYSSTSASTSVTCANCDKNHFLALCTTITDVTARKEILSKTSRCFVCLRKNHLSRECRSRFSCKRKAPLLYLYAAGFWSSN